MSLFHDILSNLQKKFQDSEGRTAEIASIISATLGIPVAASQLVIKKGTLYVQVPPTVRLALMIKKESILAACKARGITVFNLQ